MSYRRQSDSYGRRQIFLFTPDKSLLRPKPENDFTGGNLGFRTNRRSLLKKSFAKPSPPPVARYLRFCKKTKQGRLNENFNTTAAVSGPYGRLFEESI
jgi:hypothetical protein